MSKPHVFRHRMPKRVPWLVTCVYCGLIPLKNDASQRAAKKPCDGRKGLTKDEEELE